MIYSNKLSKSQISKQLNSEKLGLFGSPFMTFSNYSGKNLQQALVNHTILA